MAEESYHYRKSRTKRPEKVEVTKPGKQRGIKCVDHVVKVRAKSDGKLFNVPIWKTKVHGRRSIFMRP